jgi:hypothetical protein
MQQTQHKMRKLNVKLLDQIADKYGLKVSNIQTKTHFDCPFCDIPVVLLDVEHKEFEHGVISVNLHTLFNPFPSVFIKADAGECGYNKEAGQHLQLSLIVNTIAFLKDVDDAENELFTETT